MFLFLIITIPVLLVVDLLLTACLFVRVVWKPEREAGVSRTTEEPADKGAANPIDEGFENLMRFEVNGKTGFEEGTPWR